MADLIPEFKLTPVDDIPAAVRVLRAAFNSHKTKPLEFRLVQLRKLYWAYVSNLADNFLLNKLADKSHSLTDYSDALVEACKRDLGKSVYETYLTEIDWCKNDILFCCKNLEKWAKDETAADIPWSLKLLSPKIRKDPLGCVLVLGFVVSRGSCSCEYWLIMHH